jgi:hypothetical protein
MTFLQGSDASRFTYCTAKGETSMSQKSEGIVSLLNYIHGKQKEFFASLPEETRVADGTWEVWAPKDVVAHLTFWDNGALNTLRGLDQAPPEQAPFEQRNRENYLNNEKRPWSEVEADNEKALDEIVARTKTFSDKDLTTLNHYPRIPNGNLQGAILNNAYSHTITHLAELISKYRSPAEGQKLQEEATAKLVEFDPSPRTMGLAFYNLACSFALAGNSTRAIELLREVFPMRPDFVEFSKEDPDFNGIRELPEFQALYEVEAAPQDA